MSDLLERTLNLTMPKLKQQILESMADAGLKLNDDESVTYYSLSQVRECLHIVFGGNVAELLSDVLRNSLKKTGQFEKYGSSSSDHGRHQNTNTPS